MEEDPFEVLKKHCCISSSQEDLLANSHFAGQDDFPYISGADWPEFLSSPSSGALPIATVTIRSVPETPEPQHKDDAPSTPLPEEFKTPPEVAAPTSASSNDVFSVGRNGERGGTSPVAGDSPDLGFSGEGEIESPSRKREREKLSDTSPSVKKLKASGNLGFTELIHGTEDTVVLETEDDKFKIEEERENLEQTRIGRDAEAMNDIDEREMETENEKLDVRAEMKENGKLKLDLNLEANANSKKGGLNLIKCLIDALSNLSEVNQEGEKDEPVDIFETARRRGMTFPRSRWYDLE